MEQNFDQFERVIAEYEQTLSYKVGGTLADRTAHVLSQYRQIADNAIFETKRYLEDTKTQFKALEIVLEGVSSEGMNHGQKRVIANHVISMLRSMADRIDTTEIDYNSRVFDRYNFYRTQTPERKLYEDRANLKMTLDRQTQFLKDLHEKWPQIFEKHELPF
jgi:hypothetical protein